MGFLRVGMASSASAFGGSRLLLSLATIASVQAHFDALPWQHSSKPLDEVGDAEEGGFGGGGDDGGGNTGENYVDDPHARAGVNMINNQIAASQASAATGGGNDENESSTADEEEESEDSESEVRAGKIQFEYETVRVLGARIGKSCGDHCRIDKMDCDWCGKDAMCCVQNYKNVGCSGGGKFERECVVKDEPTEPVSSTDLKTSSDPEPTEPATSDPEPTKPLLSTYRIPMSGDLTPPTSKDSKSPASHSPLYPDLTKDLRSKRGPLLLLCPEYKGASEECQCTEDKTCQKDQFCNRSTGVVKDHSLVTCLTTAAYVKLHNPIAGELAGDVTVTLYGIRDLKEGDVLSFKFPKEFKTEGRQLARLTTGVDNKFNNLFEATSSKYGATWDFVVNSDYTIGDNLLLPLQLHVDITNPKIPRIYTFADIFVALNRKEKKNFFLVRSGLEIKKGLCQAQKNEDGSVAIQSRHCLMEMKMKGSGSFISIPLKQGVAVSACGGHVNNTFCINPQFDVTIIGQGLYEGNAKGPATERAKMEKDGKCEMDKLKTFFETYGADYDIANAAKLSLAPNNSKYPIPCRNSEEFRAHVFKTSVPTSRKGVAFCRNGNWYATPGTCDKTTHETEKSEPIVPAAIYTDSKMITETLSSEWKCVEEKVPSLRFTGYWFTSDKSQGCAKICQGMPECLIWKTDEKLGCLFSSVAFPEDPQKKASGEDDPKAEIKMGFKSKETCESYQEKVSGLHKLWLAKYNKEEDIPNNRDTWQRQRYASKAARTFMKLFKPTGSWFFNRLGEKDRTYLELDKVLIIHLARGGGNEITRIAENLKKILNAGIGDQESMVSDLSAILLIKKVLDIKEKETEKWEVDAAVESAIVDLESQYPSADLSGGLFTAISDILFVPMDPNAFLAQSKLRKAQEKRIQEVTSDKSDQDKLVENATTDQEVTSDKSDQDKLVENANYYRELEGLLRDLEIARENLVHETLTGTKTRLDFATKGGFLHYLVQALIQPHVSAEGNSLELRKTLGLACHTQEFARTSFLANRKAFKEADALRKNSQLHYGCADNFLKELISYVDRINYVELLEKSEAGDKLLLASMVSAVPYKSLGLEFRDYMNAYEDVKTFEGLGLTSSNGIPTRFFQLIASLHQSSVLELKDDLQAVILGRKDTLQLAEQTAKIRTEKIMRTVSSVMGSFSTFSAMFLGGLSNYVHEKDKPPTDDETDKKSTVNK